MVFKNPYMLFLIPVLVPLLLLLCWRQRRPAVRYSSLAIVSPSRRTWRGMLSSLPDYLRIIAVVLFILALAGPRQVLEETIVHAEGIDIVLAIDTSGSMAAEDFTLQGKRVNRLAVVKKVVGDFIDHREYDRIALVAFAALAYTVSPVTIDHNWLKENLERVDLGIIKDGTAIGSALASSVARLKDSPAKSRIIILLTDGMNNAGKIDPISAAKAAEALGIKVYTIGAGTKGYAPYPVQDIWGRKGYRDVKIDIDEDTLKKIAQMTHAQYFRATDADSLKKIYDQIDTLEKTKIEQLGYREYKELFVYVLFAALLILLIELLLSRTLLLRLP